MDKNTSAVVILVALLACGTYLMTHGYAIIGCIILGVTVLSIST